MRKMRMQPTVLRLCKKADPTVPTYIELSGFEGLETAKPCRIRHSSSDVNSGTPLEALRALGVRLLYPQGWPKSSNLLAFTRPY